ncbi:MAG: rod shape-determining protein MreC [Lachnospiraceae bacterium]|nr:rod shape-determining protein MreC [Lachnospiraceae bacterium]
MKKKKQVKLTSRHWIVIMTIVCIGLIVTSLSSDMVAAPIRSVAGYFITPFQNGINDIGNWMSDNSAGFRDNKALAEENKELQAQIDELTMKNNELMQNSAGLERLEALYQLDHDYEDYQKVAAEVISKDPGNWYSTFVINRGTNSGIDVDMNVIGQGGLIGIVTEVGANWAQVRAIIDDESNVSVMIRDTSNNFMVSGSLLEEGSGKIDFFQLRDPDDEVLEGAAVVTSNISSKFLPGLLVGYISDIKVNANELTKSGTIIPVADFTNLREVLVITDLKETKEIPAS